MNKLQIACILLVAVIAGASIAIAVDKYIIESNRVTVTVTDYENSMETNVTSCLVGETVWINGTFTKEGVPLEDQNITLVCNNALTGDWDLTDVQGYYEFFYVVSLTGSYEFYTNTTVTVP